MFSMIQLDLGMERFHRRRREVGPGVVCEHWESQLCLSRGGGVCVQVVVKYWDPSANPASYNHLPLRIPILPSSPHFQLAMPGQPRCLKSCESCVTVKVRACQAVTKEQPERQRVSTVLMWSLSSVAAEGGEGKGRDPG